MNIYTKNINKIEFVLTNACSGRCKHCSQGEHKSVGEHISSEAASAAVRSLASEYSLQTVMVFGGEPLLYAEVASDILRTASALGVPRRQLITNGYFSKNPTRIAEVARMLAESGVNDLRLSVDAFHQETIPLETVKLFAEALVAAGVPVELQPAWLVALDDDNVYNRKTREILSALEYLGMPTGAGNVIFPEGRALQYLSEYFGDCLPENPYKEDPAALRCVSVEPDGTVLGGNIYRDDILEILWSYSPPDAEN